MRDYYARGIKLQHDVYLHHTNGSLTGKISLQCWWFGRRSKEGCGRKQGVKLNSQSNHCGNVPSASLNGNSLLPDHYVGWGRKASLHKIIYTLWIEMTWPQLWAADTFLRVKHKKTERLPQLDSWKKDTYADGWRKNILVVCQVRGCKTSSISWNCTLQTWITHSNQKDGSCQHGKINLIHLADERWF